MKVLSVSWWGGWFAIEEFFLKKKDFFTPFLSICFSSMAVFAWLCFAEKNIFFFLDQIPGYSTDSITNNEEVMAAIIQQC